MSFDIYYPASWSFEQMLEHVLRYGCQFAHAPKEPSLTVYLQPQGVYTKTEQPV